MHQTISTQAEILDEIADYCDYGQNNCELIIYNKVTVTLTKLQVLR
eukprot:COSAG02_NODE_33891_length_492_cov_2.030534_1_plen_46_part_00